MAKKVLTCRTNCIYNFCLESIVLTVTIPMVVLSINMSTRCGGIHPMVKAGVGNGSLLIFFPANLKLQVNRAFSNESGKQTLHTLDYKWNRANGKKYFQLIDHTNDQNNRLSFFSFDWNNWVYVVTPIGYIYYKTYRKSNNKINVNSNNNCVT